MRYCKVENNVIVKYNQSRKDFGVGANSPEQTCIDKGYYPVTDNIPTINTATHRISGSVYGIVGETVVIAYTVVEIEVEVLIAKKVLEGESYITGLIQEQVKAFNEKYGVKFTDIHAVASYKNSVAYPLANQCLLLWNWNESMWTISRANQLDALNGIITEDEFKALLPVAPVV
ncbi:MAG: hypothetical protein GQ570_08625 [Helicobacteraceae bacterium]|nr:hypothetical protein [Helicobacteraceae bacterium]